MSHVIDPTNRYQKQYSPDFVEHWDELINWDGRGEGERGFFERLLSSHGARKVADIATGTGYHAVKLAHAGFDVIATDGSANMVEKARRNARDHGVTLADTAVADWRELPRKFGECCFDAVLCLGNAFTHLFDHEPRRDALDAMFRVLRPGGIIAVDHRNYDRMLSDGYSSKHQFYYTGHRVDVQPVELHRTLVRLEYAFENGRKFNLDLYPLRREYMTHLLHDAGFVNVSTFGDFEAPYDPNAVDFIQQVAYRPWN